MITGTDRDLFENSLRHALGPDGPASDAALAALGWREALDVDPRTTVSLLFGAAGETNAVSSALGQLVASVVAPDAVDTTVLLPALGASGPPGRWHDGRLEVDGLAVAACDEVVVIAADVEGDDVAFTVPAAALEHRTVDALDPTLGLTLVTGAVATPEVAAEISGPQPVEGWTETVRLAQLAIGHQLVGASRAVLALAREHALDRVQFGQPIARFQAVRHRLAETLVAIETADALLDAAWHDGSPAYAAMAKAQAGRSARTTARHCQQVLAGIGFTTEHDFHLFFRRVLVLDELFGSSRTLTRRLGDEILEAGELPPLLPL